MDKKLTLVVIGPIDRTLTHLLVQEAKVRGHQVIVLDHGLLPNLASEVPKLDVFVRAVGHKFNKLILLQTKVFNVHQSDVSQLLNKRVRNILKFNRVFIRRSGEQFRRRISFPCRSR